ncbi:MAG: tetratricopeptide repeat protein [Mariprofundales bacterium]|nr:tetratricopeptide repeat protein [Mariprofundales bacterium]
MKLMIQRLVITLLLSLGVSGIVAAAEPDHDVMTQVVQLQHGWAHISYEVAKDQREEAFTKLVAQANAVVVAYPQHAEPLIWEAIIRASLAGAKGGLSALGLMKDAKKLLEQAIKMDGQALHGAAYTSLGSFYYMVPGWPIGFGDDDDALKYLQQGLAIAPDNMDANYFMGDYWLDQGEKAKAIPYLEKVLKLPDVADRPVYSKGRKAETVAKLAQAR